LMAVPDLCDRCVERGFAAIRVLGPYKSRRGMRVYPYEVHFDLATGKRHTLKAGKPERAAPDVVHVEADLPWELVRDVAEAYTYADKFSMGRQRIVKPIGRLIKALGLRHHTDEEVP
ncbi:MAG: hypothetical protein V3U45_08365, partial [bacterium]